MDNEKQPVHLKGLVIGVALFFGVIFYSKVKAQMEIHLWLRVSVWVLISTLLTLAGLWILRTIERRKKEKKADREILARTQDSVYCGTTIDDEEVFVKPWQRSMHTQIIGTTNAGKTESVILPWAIQDIEQRRGLILIDGKSERGLLEKLWSYIWLYGRDERFRLVSLSSVEESHTFNPLIGGTPEEVSERVFNAFEFENAYYRSLQFEIFSQVMRIFSLSKEIPTFKKIYQALSQPDDLCVMVNNLEDKSLQTWADRYRDQADKVRLEGVSGLLAALSHFAFGKASVLFNAEKPSFTIEEAMEKNQIIYFQLPVLLSPFLGKAAGKMILQCIQSAVANRHRSDQKRPGFYSVYLDDFSEYLYPGFVSVLNKSRSANVGIVFAHQALGDIKTLGDPIANSILTNANMKVFMRGNDPDSAEYFSRVIGTEKSIKYTERTKKELLKHSGTGDASAREVDEFKVHPNFFKQELGVGEGMMLVPHAKGMKVVHVKFKKYDDLDAQPLPSISKPTPGGIRLLERHEKPKQESA